MICSLILPADVRDWPLPFGAATLEPGELAHLGNGIIPLTRSVWWLWTAPRTGRVRLITTPRSARGYELAVYRGSSLTALTPVAARTFSDSGGDLGFNSESGAQYRIALDGTYGAELQVDIELTLDGVVEAPQIASIRLDADATIQLHLRGTAGASFMLESSIDLQNWGDEQRGTIDFWGRQSVLIPAATAEH